MAQALIWSQEALGDIESIAEFISRDSPYHAQQVVERILELGESLPEQPKLGRVVPELNNPEVRERFIYSYRLIYELKATPFTFSPLFTANDYSKPWNVSLRNSVYDHYSSGSYPKFGASQRSMVLKSMPFLFA